MITQRWSQPAGPPRAQSSNRAPQAQLVVAGCGLREPRSDAWKFKSRAGFRHPQLHAVVLEQRGHQAVLAAMKCPLVLAHYDRVEFAVPVGHRRQRRGLRSARPRSTRLCPASKYSATIRLYPATSAPCLVTLPRTGCDRILVVRRRHRP